MEAGLLSVVRRVSVRRAVGAVLPVVLTAVLAGAVKGITLLYEYTTLLPVFCAAVVAGGLLVVVLLLVAGACGGGRAAGTVLVLGALLVFAGAATWLVVSENAVDQRVLHDRGVVAAGVVLAHREYGGSGGLAGSPGVVSDVRLADGSTLSVEDTGPAVDSGVTVTYDPQDRVPARFGPRPGLPGAGPTTVAEAMVVIGTLCLSAVMLSRRDFVDF
ncbi:hypothetical protein [Kitasatospora purpeofusca]|uniref:hypothetical protein n=1 Tax=Kitasatospora purpeofusca TaxID=67352 RepID=UPI00381E2986